MVTQGWTIRDNHENTVGLGRIPWTDEQACKDYCEKINREHEDRILEHRARYPQSYIGG